MRRRLRVRHAMLFAFGWAAWLVGCQLIVPSDVPDYRCTGADPAACPIGTTCDAVSLRCLPVRRVVEAGASEAAADVTGGVLDANDAAGPANLGGSCLADRDCREGLLCGTSTILTTAIVATSGKPICTKPCCTSADCPASFICFSAGTGGNYCVSAALAQRSPTGSKTPGSVCTEDLECRSGLCAKGHCLDSCCSVTDCAGPTTCRVESVDVPPPAHETWACAIPELDATTEVGASCSGPVPRCKNDNCAGFQQKCRPPCCSSAQCATLGNSFAICAYGKFLASNSDTKWCFEANVNGTAVLGATCNGDIDCASRLCDLETKKCAAACCEDADCPADLVCRPSPVGAPLLRCIPGRR